MTPDYSVVPHHQVALSPSLDSAFAALGLSIFLLALVSSCQSLGFDVSEAWLYASLWGPYRYKGCHTVVSCWEHPFKKLDRHWNPGVSSKWLNIASNITKTSKILQKGNIAICPGSSPVQIQAAHIAARS